MNEQHVEDEEGPTKWTDKFIISSENQVYNSFLIFLGILSATSCFVNAFLSAFEVDIVIDFTKPWQE